MVSSLGVKRVLCDPRSWSGVRGDTRPEQVAYAALGAYKCAEDVPQKHRLQTFMPQYEDRSLMDEFLDAYKPDAAESYRERKYHRVCRAVEDYLDGEGHYAFLTPQQVDGFFATITDMRLRSQYEVYLGALRTMYEWLIFSVEYPHRYNPLDMAILEHGALHNLIENWLDHKSITENNG